MLRKCFMRLMPSLVVIMFSMLASGCLSNITTVGNLFSETPTISTGLSDVKSEVPYLDNYNPASLTPLEDLPRGPNGEFILRPGKYEFNAMSYCLHAGTYGPGGGDGYAYAPLQGERAEVIKKVLRNSYRHPEIQQQHVQMLLWAIVERTKINDMPKAAQLAAARLLTPSEIFEINGGALGLIPEDITTSLLSKTSPQLQPMFEARAKLRQLLTQANATYEEMEKVAVLLGNPVPGKGSREIPVGRWSYQGGYFVRYLPQGYSKTKIQIVVPEKKNINFGHDGTAGKGLSDGGSSSHDGGSADSGVYDPSNDVAVPGNTSRQRLAQSGRPSEPPSPQDKCEEMPGGSIDFKIDDNGNITGATTTITENNACIRPCVEQHEQIHEKQAETIIPEIMQCYRDAEKGKRPIMDCYAIALFKASNKGECEAYNVSVPCVEKRLKTAKECQSSKNQDYGKRKLKSETCFRRKYCGK